MVAGKIDTREMLRPEPAPCSVLTLLPAGPLGVFMTRFLVLALLGLALGAPAGLSQPAAKRPLNLDDLARLRTLGDPQLSPDGKWVAYTVATVDAEKDKRDTDLWMTSWDGTRHVRLTSSPESSESEPRWSPDGR